ncbi:MAG: hypothetical protein LBE12_19090 [Planctomycetaceae bacterium]|nr:hypothetical protein [Planctomycetaceae bacterium]
MCLLFSIIFVGHFVCEGKQEVRNLFSSIGVTVMNMPVYNVTELCCRNIPSSEIVDRSCSTLRQYRSLSVASGQTEVPEITILAKRIKGTSAIKAEAQKIFEKLKAL